jgi:vancomycin aglycone glucosyltransferase
VLPDERPLDPELEAFLAAGEPPVYFGFGSMRMPAELASVIVAAVRAVGRRAVVAAGWAGLAAPDGEGGCLGIGEVNQQALFSRVAAVVHHGGAGTTTAAALAGVPQVIIPQAYDQHYWAQRVTELGIGAACRAGPPDAGSLATALQWVLQPAVAARAQALRPALPTTGTHTAAAGLTTGTPARSRSVPARPKAASG